MSAQQLQDQDNNLLASGRTKRASSSGGIPKSSKAARAAAVKRYKRTPKERRAIFKRVDNINNMAKFIAYSAGLYGVRKSGGNEIGFNVPSVDPVTLVATDVANQPFVLSYETLQQIQKYASNRTVDLINYSVYANARAPGAIGPPGFIVFLKPEFATWWQGTIAAYPNIPAIQSFANILVPVAFGPGQQRFATTKGAVDSFFKVLAASLQGVLSQDRSSLNVSILGLPQSLGAPALINFAAEPGTGNRTVGSITKAVVESTVPAESSLLVSVGPETTRESFEKKAKNAGVPQEAANQGAYVTQANGIRNAALGATALGTQVNNTPNIVAQRKAKANQRRKDEKAKTAGQAKPKRSARVTF